MKGIRFMDETMGAQFETLGIPEEMKDEVAACARAGDRGGLRDLRRAAPQYLEGKELTSAEIRAALRKGRSPSTSRPFLCGASFKNKGVQQLLDAIVDYLPSPLDVPPIDGTLADGKTEVVRRTSDTEPFAALVFKIMTDPYVGQLAFIRVYSGRLLSGEHVLNATNGSRERVGRLLQMHANKREEVKEVWAGDIAACVGLRSVHTGDTICDEKAPIVLEPMDSRNRSSVSRSNPRRRSIRRRWAPRSTSWRRRTRPSRSTPDPETAQTIISGMGELHLEIITDRLVREFGSASASGKPQVAYKETIRQPAKAEGKYIKQTGGRGQYGHVKLEVSPLPPGSGFEFLNEIVGGRGAQEYIKPIQEGIKEAMQSGPISRRS